MPGGAREPCQIMQIEFSHTGAQAHKIDAVLRRPFVGNGMAYYKNTPINIDTHARRVPNFVVFARTAPEVRGDDHSKALMGMRPELWRRASWILGEPPTLLTPSRIAALPLALAAIVRNLAQDDGQAADAESNPRVGGRFPPHAQANVMTLIRQQGGAGRAECPF